MSTTERTQPAYEGRAFISMRTTKSSPSRAEAILSAAQILSRELSTSIQYDWETKQRIELAETEIADWLENIDEQWRRGREHVMYGLLNAPSKPTVLFHWSQFSQRRPREEKIKCTIPYETPLEPLSNVFSEFNSYFKASYSYMYNVTLQNLHSRATRKYEREVAEMKPEERHRILKPCSYEGVDDILPPLLLSGEFNPLHVPDGISWINYWSSLQVETVGLSRIRIADWERLIELPDGGVVVAVTEEPFDVTNSDHMLKLKGITEHLHLREIQEQHRIK